MPTNTPLIDYPYWKQIAWRFLRAGVAGGVATMLTVTVVLNEDLSNTRAYGAALGSAFIAGFVAAAGKAVRDYLSEGDKGAAVQKLPV